ncbi:MAG: ATP-binding protein [Candidatus Pacebacteria bacterium]|nr:ATP-binding protein [Candidatus Paceibacterota bacterium]
MIKRELNLENNIQKNKVVIIYGARRVGKTTLLNDFLKKTKLKYRLDNGDNIRLQELLQSQDFNRIKEYVEGYELIAIDEAQQVPNIGMALKIIVDQVKAIRVIVTGSSSFDLSQKIGEPLTGRKKTFVLYPFSQLEMRRLYNKHELKEKLESFLVFGGYPDVVLAKTKKEKISILNELVDSYLLKDVLTLDNIKFSKKLLDLLKSLAFQVGNLVSLNELSQQVGLDVKTIDRYLDLLEKGFVIKRLGGFSRNLRNEITNKSKYYFLDNGIRNALISQFNSLDKRDDIGALFENFLMMDRIKNNNLVNNYYFWRNYEGKEIDLIEEKEGALYAYEFKWNKTEAKPPKNFIDSYKNSKFEVINKDNYLDFLITNFV